MRDPSEFAGKGLRRYQQSRSPDAKTAGLLLYALQTASSNLARTTFEPNRHHVILNPAAAHETLLGESIWEDKDFEEDEDDDDDEVTEPAVTQAPAQRPVRSKTREEWQAETEAKRNATLDTTPFSARIPPARVPLSALRTQIADQIREAFPDLARPTRRTPAAAGKGC